MLCLENPQCVQAAQFKTSCPLLWCFMVMAATFWKLWPVETGSGFHLHTKNSYSLFLNKVHYLPLIIVLPVGEGCLGHDDVHCKTMWMINRGLLQPITHKEWHRREVVLMQFRWNLFHDSTSQTHLFKHDFKSYLIEESWKHTHTKLLVNGTEWIVLCCFYNSSSPLLFPFLFPRCRNVSHN